MKPILHLSLPVAHAGIARFGDHRVRWLCPVSTDHEGTPRQQTEATVSGRSDTAMALEWYAEPAVGLEQPPHQPAPPPTR